MHTNQALIHERMIDVVVQDALILARRFNSGMENKLIQSITYKRVP